MKNFLLVLLLSASSQEAAPVPQEAAPPKKAPAEWGVRDWGKCVDSLRQGEDWGHHYKSERAKCPLCGLEFAAAAVSTHTTSGVDLDFKTARYVSANPYLFQLWMCPSCNYCASADEFGEPLAPDVAAKLKKALDPPTKYADYFEIPMSVLLQRARTRLEAIAAPTEQVAWLELFGAWMARDYEQPEAEKEYHLRARAAFEVVVEKGEGNTRAAAAYLVAEIHRRHGTTADATAWLDRAEKIAAEVGSKNIPNWVKRCRAEIEQAKAPAEGEKRE